MVKKVSPKGLAPGVFPAAQKANGQWIRQCLPCFEARVLKLVKYCEGKIKSYESISLLFGKNWSTKDKISKKENRM